MGVARASKTALSAKQQSGFRDLFGLVHRVRGAGLNNDYWYIILTIDFGYQSALSFFVIKIAKSKNDERGS